MNNTNNYTKDDIENLLTNTPPNIKLPSDRKHAILKKLLLAHTTGDVMKENQRLNRKFVICRFPKVAAAILIFFVISSFFIMFNKFRPTKQGVMTSRQPQLKTALNAQLRPEPAPASSSKLAKPTIGEKKGTFAVSIDPISHVVSTTTPGPNEVCLNTNLLGQQQILQVPDHGWIKIGKGLFIDLWQYTTEGKYVGVMQKGAFIYISVDDGPLQLVGVRLQRRDDLEFLRAALLESDSPLTLWCDIQPPTEISDLPNLEKITSFQQVNPKLLSDLSPLAHLANLESIYMKHRYQYYPQCLDLSALSSLKNL